MSSSPFEQTIFTCFPSNSPSIQSNTDKHLIATKFTCSVCDDSKNTLHTLHQQSKTFVPHILFNCKKCNYKWNICTLCNYDDQPKLISRRNQRRSRHLIDQQLRIDIENHSSKHHSNELKSYINLSSSITTSDDFYHHNENSSLCSDGENNLSFIENDMTINYPNSTVKKVSSTLKQDLLIVFPDVGDTQCRNFYSNIRQVLYDKIIHHSYTQYLIKKTWLNSMDDELSIHPSECHLFLCIIRQLIMHSRQERAKIVDIYGRIENSHDRQINELQNHILKLEGIVSSQKNEISSLQSLLNNHSTNQRIIHKFDKFTSHIDMTTSSNHTSYLTKLPLPHTLQDTRKLIESPSSFVNALLAPPIEVNPTDGYAYILPSKVLPIYISSGLDFEHITSDTSTEMLHPRSKYRSPDINSILQKFIHSHSTLNINELGVGDNNQVYYIGLGLWSDGCDAGSASKANRSLVKLMTIHLLHPNLKEKHVFPIGFGNNKGNHEFLRNKILHDIQDMCDNITLCYVPSLQKIIPITFFLAYVIQDRVEHCDFTGFSAHSGIFSTVPGISCPFQIISERNDHSHQISTQRSIASCSLCAEYRLQQFFKKKYLESSKSNIYCPNCTDWDLLTVRYEPHKEYPKDLPDYDINKLMKAKTITFKSMINACETIHERVYLYQWNKKNVDKYAQTECIKNSIVNQLYKYTTSVRPQKNLAHPPIPRLPNNILPTGMTQSIIRLDQIVVSVMHTLILNLGKHLLLLVKSFLNNGWTNFYITTNNFLIDIQSLSLSWCKCFRYGSDKLPGSLWVSDNYLGFSLVCKHIFSILNTDEDDDLIYIIDTIWCYHSLVSVVMNANEWNDDFCDKAEALSKIFLSSFNKVDQHISKRNQDLLNSVSHRRNRVKKDVSKIESTSCVLNVLTVVKEMRNKGIQRNFWEGGLSGEGMFRIVKQYVKRGLGQLGVFKSTLKKLYNCREINSMINDDNCKEINQETQFSVNTNEEEEEIFDNDRYRRFHCYRTYAVISDSIVNSRAIASFFLKNEKKVYCMFKKKKNRYLIELKPKNWSVRFSTNIFQIDISQETTSYKISDITSNPNHYISILILPLFDPTIDGNSHEYYAYSEDHYELTETLDWEVPQIINTTSDVVLKREPIWTSRNLCTQLIGREVLPLDGIYPGKIISFRHQHNQKDKDHAQWMVKYFKDDINDENVRAYRNVEYCYDKLIEIMK